MKKVIVAWHDRKIGSYEFFDRRQPRKPSVRPVKEGSNAVRSRQPSLKKIISLASGVLVSLQRDTMTSWQCFRFLVGGRKGGLLIACCLVLFASRAWGQDGRERAYEDGEDRGPRFVTRVQEETDDVLAAAEFVKTLPYADATRVGVMGWSFGGIVSVFAASRSSTFRVVVDQAGAALTWNRSPAMQQALTDAAGHIRVPLLAMVAENDQTTESAKTVVKEAEKRNTPAKLIIYPAFTPHEELSNVAPGHMIFAAEGAHIWKAEMREFLARYLGKM